MPPAPHTARVAPTRAFQKPVAESTVLRNPKTVAKENRRGLNKPSTIASSYEDIPADATQ